VIIIAIRRVKDGAAKHGTAEIGRPPGDARGLHRHGHLDVARGQQSTGRCGRGEGRRWILLVVAVVVVVAAANINIDRQ
jgi:hypothetical protein